MYVHLARTDQQDETVKLLQSIRVKASPSLLRKSHRAQHSHSKGRCVSADAGSLVRHNRKLPATGKLLHAKTTVEILDLEAEHSPRSDDDIGEFGAIFAGNT